MQLALCTGTWSFEGTTWTLPVWASRQQADTSSPEPQPALAARPTPPAQGLEHANYATAAENLAAALQRRGQWDEARGLMHKALETRRFVGLG